MKAMPTLLGLLALASALLLAPAPARALNPAHLAAPASGCFTCHTLHQAPGSGLLKDVSRDVLCLTCHGPAGPSVLKADVHRNQSCATCHTSHSNLPNYAGGTNLELIGRNLDGTGLAKILTPGNGARDVAFESRGTGVGQPSARSFADGNGPYDGICEVCHTQTQFHRNNPTGLHNHEAGATCVNCHKHEEQFKGSCTNSGCHAPGSALDPLITGGTGINGKHVTHVTGKGQPCTTCHSGYFSAATHRNGVMNGKADAVNPVAFNALNPGGSYTDNSPSGSGTCSGTSCHQNNVLNWYAASATPAWPATCTGCHSAGSAIDPLVLGGTGAAGKHGRHVTDRGIACSQCHAQYTASPQSTALHMNGQLDADTSASLVSFSAPQNSAGTWRNDVGASTGTCANLWCHGATGNQGVTSVPNEPAWYAATTGIACTGCHSGGSFTDPLVINSSGTAGQHVRHVADRGYACTNCHNGYNGNAAHVNYQFDTRTVRSVYYDANNPYADAGWNQTAASCGRTYCHGATKNGTSVANNVPSWYTTATLTCTNCHSRSGTVSFLDPVNRDQTAPGAMYGLHPIHVSSKTIPCVVCHGAYTQRATHGNLNEVAGNPEAWTRSDLLDFNPQVSTNASAPDTYWGQDSGTRGSGGCGGSLCHYPGKTQNHSGFNNLPGPVAGWYGR